MGTARRWVSDHREVSGTLAITLGTVVPNVVLGNGEGALIALAIGVLLLGLYVGLDRLLDRRER